MSKPSIPTEFLAYAGRLLLEYNASTGAIHRALLATANEISTEECQVAISYNGIAVSLGMEKPILLPVRELRYNSAVYVAVHQILRQVRRSEVEIKDALLHLKHIEIEYPPHSRWVAVLHLGIASAGLAALLGGDMGSVVVAGLATAIGLIARQALGRRHFSLLTLPFVAAFIGAFFGCLALRLGWTDSPGLALIVPSLMLIPGPHLINGLMDVVDNFLPMSLARLGLAAAILLASTLGIVLGIEIMHFDPPAAEASAVHKLNLVSDMILAGIVTCGFAIYYNTAWRHIGMAMFGGMVGHGLRFLALQSDWRLDTATFLGGFAVGCVSAWMAQRKNTPVAIMGFAGAVTMMPGTQIYRALAGLIDIARAPNSIEIPRMKDTLGYALQSLIVVAALALGFIIAMRTVWMFSGKKS